MKIAGIDFPEQLLTALRDKRLVVFAGAGISMGKPAKLPNFTHLAKRIAEGTGKRPDKDDSIDQFLGQLAASGIKVHELATEILSRDGPLPTPLHGELLRCFGKDDPVRLVTTNFDLLFERAAEEVLASPAGVYTAPALPIGSDFEGLVHIHGSLVGSETMVLTDADFGRAYLTEGWANRFLVDLFQSFTVLFVGYRHDDAVVTYLARALPPADPNRIDGPHRFALTDEAPHRRWALLGISPISYPMASPNDHSGLNDGVRELATYMQTDTLGSQRRIGGIAQGLPPLDSEDGDLIHDALRDPSRIRFFTDEATDPAWIGWLERRGHLAAMFDQGLEGHGDGSHDQLAWWLCNRFAREHADQLLKLFGRRGPRMSRRLWIALASELVSIDTETQLTHEWEPAVVAKWISLLLDTVPQDVPAVDVYLGQIAQAAASADLDRSLVSVFDAMSRPLIPTQREFVGEHWVLRSVWHEHLASRLPMVAEDLLGVVNRRLRERHELLRVWERATRTSDYDTWHRNTVETDQHDSRYDEPIDVLIDTARDCSVYLAENEPSVAPGYIDRMIRADAPLLRRIAVHAESHRADLSADQKIQWLLDNVGLYDRACKREVISFTEQAYPAASDAQRNYVLAAVEDHPNAGLEPEGRGQFVVPTKMAWLARLRRVAPECPRTKAALDRLQVQFPDIEVDEEVGDEFPRSGITRIDPESPWTAQELLRRPAIEWLGQLIDFRSDDPLGPTLQGLAGSLEKAATQDVSWGIELGNALAENQQWDVPLWEALLSAWKTEIGEEHHRQVLSLLANPNLHRHHVRAACGVLAELVKSGGRAYAPGLLAPANDLALELWPHAAADAHVSEQFDWLNLAINRAAGPLAQFWLGSLSIGLREHQIQRGRLAEPYRAAFDALVQDDTPAGLMCRAVLMTNFAFVLNVDEAWTRDHLVPLLTADPKSDAYQAVWDGLMYGQLSVPAVDVLTEPFKCAAEHIQRFRDPRTRERFVDDLAGLLIDFVDDPIDEWIPGFLPNAEAADRQRFAWAIWRRLGDMSDAEQKELWNRWLRSYWDNRTNGLPTTPDGAEVEWMLNWLPQLHSVFADGVGLAMKMPDRSVEASRLLWALKDTDHCEREPDAVADLLIRLFGSASVRTPLVDRSELFERLLQSGLTDARRESLENLRARMGSK